MRTIKFFISIALLFLAVACNGQTQNAKKAVNSDKIEVYYFHYTARCVTCKALEAEAKKDVETLYPELVKAGKMTFQSVNLEDKSGETLADKLKVYGQTLLIVKGKKQINLTNEGFLYCRSDADKFKAIIKEKIDGLK